MTKNAKGITIREIENICPVQTFRSEVECWRCRKVEAENHPHSHRESEKALLFKVVGMGWKKAQNGQGEFDDTCSECVSLLAGPDDQDEEEERHEFVTAQEQASKIIGRDATNGEDFEQAGVPILGGCECCGAGLAAYNAFPSRSGRWRCGDCIGDFGYRRNEIHLIK